MSSGLAYPYIKSTLEGGNAGFGLVFAAIFIGIALGMPDRPPPARRLQPPVAVRVTITAAAVPLALIGLVPNLIMITVFVVVLGALSGIAYATGFTIVGLEVDDDTRGRVFAFFQSSIQVILLVVIASSPFLSAALTKLIGDVTGSGDIRFAHVVYTSVGQNVVILLAAVVAAVPPRGDLLPADGRPQGSAAAGGPAVRGARRAVSPPVPRGGAPQRAPRRRAAGRPAGSRSRAARAPARPRRPG